MLPTLTIKTTMFLLQIGLISSQTIDQNLMDLARKKFRMRTTLTTPSEAPTPSVRDHIRIVESVHRSLLDGHYRNIWFGLIERNYSLFLRQMRDIGPKKFMKKAAYNDDTFEGHSGKRRWNFTLDYFKRLNKTTFYRMVDLFAQVDQQTKEATPTRYATIPLPSGYWEKANADYWAAYTEPPGLNPWRNTIPYAEWHGINYDYIWPKDPNVWPYIKDGRIIEWWTRAEWVSTPYPNQTARPKRPRSYNASDLWKYDVGIGYRYYTSPNYYY